MTEARGGAAKAMHARHAALLARLPGPFSRASTEGAVDVLLAHALFTAFDDRQIEKLRPYPPLATLYAAAVLREQGRAVAVFDAMLAPDETAFDEALTRHCPRLVVLYEDSFNFLSKMCLDRMRRAALTMIELAGERGVPVVVAGSDATDEPAVYLAAGACAVILGEGDHTVGDVTAALLAEGGRAELDHVAGLALCGDVVAVRRTAARTPERHPDVFPWPARDLVDLTAYRQVWHAVHGRFSLNMVSTRGCPFHCNWCAKPIWGQRYAMRDPHAVAEEMGHLSRAWHADHVWFADDIFGLRTDWTAAFGQAVATLGDRVPFQIQTRVDLVTEDAADGLARAGCAEVWLGIESGSQRILDAMDKGIRVDDVGPAVRRLRSRGIRVCFFLQLGYPGETWADIQATMALVRELLPDDVGVSVSYPLPGTRFHAMVAHQVGAQRRWCDSRDLAMLFQGRYTTAFYRRLHDAVHGELDALHALARTASAGFDTDAARRALAAARAEWDSLARDERSNRSDTPTDIALPAHLSPAPDLSRPAN